MDYAVLASNDAEKVTSVITGQNKKLTALINKTDLFWQGWAENIPNGKVFVQYKGHIPIYIKKEYYLFQRVQISQYERKIIEGSKIEKSSKALLKELLKEIGINRVNDEDGCNGFFTKLVDDKYGKEDHAYCYVNADMPDGYWENHILETRFVELY